MEKLSKQKLRAAGQPDRRDDPNPAKPAGRNQQKLNELNGLRLIAILMLVYFHYFALVKYFFPDFNVGPWQPLLNLADYGFTATGLFFILSGFILFSPIAWIGFFVSGICGGIYFARNPERNSSPL